MRQETERLKAEISSGAAVSEKSMVSLQKLQGEKELLQKNQGELEKLRAAAEKRYAELEKRYIETERARADLDRKLRESEIRKAETESRIGALQSELARAGTAVRERDALMADLERLRQESIRIQNEAGLRSSALQQSGEEIRKVRAERDLLQNQIADMRGQAQSGDKLQSKLKLTEMQKNELEARIRKLTEERAADEKRLRDKDALIFRLEKAQAETERLRRDTRDAAETAKKLDEANRLLAILNEDYKSLMRRYEEVSRQKDQGRPAHVPEPGRTSSDDAPAVKIGGRQYSRYQIIEESLISSRVLSGMKIENVPWRRGNPYDDFVVEQILYAKAGESSLRVKQEAVERMVQRYRLDSRERDYLIKYMTIEEFIGRKIRDQAVDEAQVRAYYQNNRHLYATNKEEKMVSALVLPYTAGSQLDGAIRMTELQAEASGGRSLDMLHRTSTDGLLLRQMRYRDLPAWIQEKLQDLKAGETSSVISTDDQYMLYQVRYAEGSVRPYDEVKDAIRNTLAVAEVLGPWLGRIRKEAEEIR